MSTSASTSARQQKLADWLRPHVQWVTIPSWLLSVAGHIATVFVCIALSQTPSCRSDIQGEGGESFREVGIYLAESEPSPAAGAADAAVGETSVADETSSPPSLDAPPVAIALPETASIPVLGVGGVPSLGAPPQFPGSQAETRSGAAGGAGGVPDPRGGGGGATSLFGASASGSKFVYVIDRSWSMAGSGVGVTPISMAKTELIASISQLDEKQQFQIVLYNDGPTVLIAEDGRFDYFFGTDAQRLDAVRQLAQISPTGGTNHFPALQQALELAPDVVFFLTDGQEPSLSARELNELGKRNRGATIHCIEFGKGPPIRDPAGGLLGNWLRKLASENGGRYVYHDTSQVEQ
ncbi:MAG: VWA domain-containing protein [Planctomycetaceae bacterium]|nr:VWA domain-containing protein [Planctomycetaceae bacterium]